MDSFAELPKEKRPPDSLIWYGSPDDIENWFDKVFNNKRPQDEFVLHIKDDDIG